MISSDEKAFKLIQRTEKLWNRLVLPWLGDDEKVLLISRRHPFFLLLRILLAGGVGLAGGGILLSLAITPTGVSTGLLIFALFILLLGAFVSIWAGLEWTNDYFFITAERVLIQKKMAGFFDSRQESPYNAILSTGVESSFWGRLIGFGSIHLHSYTGDITFKRLPYPKRSMRSSSISVTVLCAILNSRIAKKFEKRCKTGLKAKRCAM